MTWIYFWAFFPIPLNYISVFCASTIYFEYCTFVQFSSVVSHVWLFSTPWIAAHQAYLSITNSWSFTQTHVHRVGDAIQPSHPLSSHLLLPPILVGWYQANNLGGYFQLPSLTSSSLSNHGSSIHIAFDIIDC